MKQNASHLMQPDAKGKTIFEWPDPKRTRPETGVLIAEAKEQMLRESAHTMKSGAGMTKPVFPKPVGYDNDLIRALELGLMGARKYVTSMSNLSGKIVVHGARLEPPNMNAQREQFKRDMVKRVSPLGATEINFQWAT